MGPTLFVGAVAGIIAGLVVLASQRIRQWWLDSCSAWPFEVYAVGLKVYRLTVVAATPWEARIWVRNKTSRDARLIATPQDQSGHALSSGWDLLETWAGRTAPLFLKVESKRWIEFQLTGHGEPPTFCQFQAAFFTLVKMKSRTYACDFSYPIGSDEKPSLWKPKD